MPRLYTLFFSLMILPIVFADTTFAVDFEKDVQPIFQKHCLACHGPEKQESNLRLDRQASLLRGGDFGEPSIVPGKAESSFLIEVVQGKNPDITMPPKGKPLTKANRHIGSLD